MTRDVNFDSFGSDVYISGDGSRIVVSAARGDGDSMLFKKNSGEITVLEFNAGGQIWNKIGSKLSVMRRATRWEKR